MRALSLWQPWASLIAEGHKTIETRRWTHPPEAIVGQRLAIHAAKRWDCLAWREVWMQRGIDMTYAWHIHPGTCPEGVILAHARVDGVFRANSDAWQHYALCRTVGQVCIELSDVVRLPEPLPWRGSQGFFRVPDERLLAAQEA